MTAESSMSPHGQTAIERHNAMRAKVRDPEPDPATPQLKGQIRIELHIEQDVNLIAYFQTLPERAREQYRRLRLDGHEAWERPVAFLLGDGDGDVDLCASPLPWQDGATWHEIVDVTECELRVHLRPGSRQRVYGFTDTEWCEQDFETLRANVPWLDQTHLDMEALGDEEREAGLARRPGPLDSPLEGL